MSATRAIWECCRSRTSVRLVLVGLTLAVARPATAHPPYEHPERIITGADGRPLHLLKSYVDGIFLTDPVKLVVRDADDRTLLETEYGRDLSVVCWRPPTCLVFRYDGWFPILPENVWQLRDVQLVESHSIGLVALGVVAPLWDHAIGYLLSFVSLGIPVLVLRLLHRPETSPARMAAVAFVGLAAVPYLGVWLYTVVLLSELSLPLVVLVCLTGGAALAVGRRATLRVGIREETLFKVTKAFGVAVAILAAVAVIALIVVAVRVASLSRNITFDEPPVEAPLAKASITRHDGVTSEVFATLATGVQLENAVNLDLFEGFDASMTREEAEQRLGPASGRWTDPAYKQPASYYDRPDGRVSLIRQGASSWSTVGHPSTCTHDYVFRDSRLRDQIALWLPPNETVQVNVLRQIGWGGLTVHVSRNACTYLVLTARDTDAERRN